MRIGGLFIGWRKADHEEAEGLGLDRADRGKAWHLFVFELGDFGMTILAEQRATA